MKYTTIQSTESNCFSHDPSDVTWIDNLDDAKQILDQWGDLHEQVGTDRQYAVVLLFKGKIHDTTDLYPDKVVCYGPRGGIRVENC